VYLESLAKELVGGAEVARTGGHFAEVVQAGGDIQTPGSQLLPDGKRSAVILLGGL
jgi:hypothetical protein